MCTTACTTRCWPGSPCSVHNQVMLCSPVGSHNAVHGTQKDDTKRSVVRGQDHTVATRILVRLIPVFGPTLFRKKGGNKQHALCNVQIDVFWPHSVLSPKKRSHDPCMSYLSVGRRAVLVGIDASVGGWMLITVSIRASGPSPIWVHLTP